MSEASRRPPIRAAEDLAYADWTALTTDQLPAYKSPEIFALFERLDVTLDEFRAMWVYHHAVVVKLIVGECPPR